MSKAFWMEQGDGLELMAGGRETAAGSGKSEEINRGLPALLNEMSSKEFEETDEVQVGGCGN